MATKHQSDMSTSDYYNSMQMSSQALNWSSLKQVSMICSMQLMMLVVHLQIHLKPTQFLLHVKEGDEGAVDDGQVYVDLPTARRVGLGAQGRRRGLCRGG